MEGPALASRFFRAFGRLGERGPPDGRKIMVIPGFVASDRTTLGLQRALARAGFRVTGWGMGLNLGVRTDTRERLAEKIAAFGQGEKVILVGWSLGGVYARDLALQAPEMVRYVVTLGSPFANDVRATNATRLYEALSGETVEVNSELRTAISGPSSCFCHCRTTTR